MGLTVAAFVSSHWPKLFIPILDPLLQAHGHIEVAGDGHAAKMGARLYRRTINRLHTEFGKDCISQQQLITTPNVDCQTISMSYVVGSLNMFNEVLDDGVIQWWAIRLWGQYHGRHAIRQEFKVVHCWKGEETRGKVISGTLTMQPYIPCITHFLPTTKASPEHSRAALHTLLYMVCAGRENGAQPNRTRAPMIVPSVFCKGR